MPHIAAVSPTTHRLVAAGIAAAVPLATWMFVATSAAAQNTPHVAIPILLSSTVDLSGTQEYLYNPDAPLDVNFIHGTSQITAEGWLGALHGDTPLVFHDSPAAAAALNWDQLVGLMTIGQLSDAEVQHPTSVLSATGDYIPAITSTIGVNVTDDTTATQLLTGAINEANITTTSLQNLDNLLIAQTPHIGLGITDQVGATGDLLSFQEDINGSINALNNALDPATLSAYDSNHFLDAMLHGLLVSETNMNSVASDVAAQFAAGNLSHLAADDAAILTNSLAEYGYMQGIVGFFSFENTFNDVSSWFSAL
ncbi:hypothetical protein [[Mycobacterium] crassicus]|uniref:Uncharacterized protein n=1 Tax=[Mycobacterium] crassicus TaxID=2872309 RepID=A0ABU5XDN4_9MYCO|nr:hypothetical protein [Mycolicibacter sp. MYC098]MEB3020423.1 hypothetical protein [Mycolicibacter sp. MYC098]